jgi:hypothetical protein
MSVFLEVSAPMALVGGRVLAPLEAVVVSLGPGGGGQLQACLTTITVKFRSNRLVRCAAGATTMNRRVRTLDPASAAKVNPPFLEVATVASAIHLGPRLSRSPTARLWLRWTATLPITSNLVPDSTCCGAVIRGSALTLVLLVSATGG